MAASILFRGKVLSVYEAERLIERLQNKAEFNGEVADLHQARADRYKALQDRCTDAYVQLQDLVWDAKAASQKESA